MSIGLQRQHNGHNGEPRDRNPMPSLASLPSGPSSVIGKLTGKRQVKEIIDTRPLSPPLESIKESASNGHRRDSSALSFAGVTELGQNVKRSVSLRSHRSNPSGSTIPYGHRTRTSSSAAQFQPAFAAPTAEYDEPINPLRPTQTSPPQLPIPRGKRNLSSKFSAQTLQTYTHPEAPDSTADKPATAAEIFNNMTTLLVAPPPNQSNNVRKASVPDRPPLPSNHSIASSDGTIQTTPSTQLQHNERLYMQSTATPVPYHASTHDPKAVYKTIHEISSKRMATIEYLRKVHEGNIFYFSTLHYSPQTLQSVPSMHASKLGRRATNYFVLGYSLPALLDLNSGSPLEYLRALASLLQEFETYQNLMGMDSSGNSLSKGRVQQMFKLGARNAQSKGRRTSSVQDGITLEGRDILGLPRAAGSEAASPLETSPSPISPSGHDFHHLVTPHLPFDPDFNTIHATLCDTLIDTYAKLIELVSSPDVCSPAVGDWFTKVDKTIRKILMAGVIREFEENTKTTVKSEVAGLGKLVMGGLM